MSRFASLFRLLAVAALAVAAASAAAGLCAANRASSAQGGGTACARIHVHFLLGIERTGSFKVYTNIEALP